MHCFANNDFQYNKGGAVIDVKGLHVIVTCAVEFYFRNWVSPERRASRREGRVSQTTKTTESVDMETDSASLVEMAKFAEQAERYEDMAKVSLDVLQFSSP